MVPTKEFFEEKESLEKEISAKLQDFSKRNGLMIVSADINHIMPEKDLTVELKIVFGR